VVDLDDEQHSAETMLKSTRSAFGQRERRRLPSIFHRFVVAAAASDARAGWALVRAWLAALEEVYAHS